MCGGRTTGRRGRTIKVFVLVRLYRERETENIYEDQHSSTKEHQTLHCRLIKWVMYWVWVLVKALVADPRSVYRRIGTGERGQAQGRDVVRATSTDELKLQSRG